MIAGASNSDSDFLDAVVTVMRRSSSRLMSASSRAEVSGTLGEGRMRRTRQGHAGERDGYCFTSHHSTMDVSGCPCCTFKHTRYQAENRL